MDSQPATRARNGASSPSTPAWIDSPLFHQILALMPIPAVHAIITARGHHLLLRRRIAPLLGGWWIPGGRVHKYEALPDAIRREVREETGLTCCTIQSVGTVTFLIDDIHTISTIFWIQPVETTVRLNYEHSAYQWVDALPQDCHPALREIFALVR
jgi:ADP-ribose pyrophosphatase YjhB (NUDIX family)